MKIIKRGAGLDPKPFETSCTRCGTVFEFDRGDAKYQDDQRDGAYWEVACPKCGERTFVAAELTGWLP